MLGSADVTAAPSSGEAVEYNVLAADGQPTVCLPFPTAIDAGPRSQLLTGDARRKDRLIVQKGLMEAYMPCDQDTPPVRCVKGQRVTGASRERLRAEVARGYSQDLSIAELAERFGRSPASVRTLLIEAGVSIRPQGSTKRARSSPASSPKP
ncbi:hypothetical protein GCM10029964_092500 [Kibdelosporangium lantanae]